VREDRIRQWIEEILGYTIGARDSPLLLLLKDGVVLVKLMNKLMADCHLNARPIKYSESHSIWQRRVL
jgi:hypothetical protein